MPYLGYSCIAPGFRRLAGAALGTAVPRPARLLIAIALAGVLAAGCSTAKSASPPSPEKAAATLIEDGIKAGDAHDTVAAIKDFQRAATKDPADPIPYYDLGVIYEQSLGEPTLAVAEFEKALLADADYRPALLDMAISETKIDPRAALADYKRLLTIDPDGAQVYLNLGLLQISLKETAAGRASLRKAVKLDPSLAKQLPKGVKL